MIQDKIPDFLLMPDDIQKEIFKLHQFLLAKSV
jgi:hypothetical protein